MPESYKHLFAKQLLVQWLRERTNLVRLVVENDYRLLSFGRLKAFSPVANQSYGIYEEYPVCILPDGKTTLHRPWIASNIPSYEALIARNFAPLYILDIAILSMNSIKYGIEIVHTHPVGEGKIEALRSRTRDIAFELYQVDAEWVLCNCSPPYKLEARLLIAATADADDAVVAEE